MKVIVYKVAPGDQLFRIAARHYGQARFASNRDAIVAAIRAYNPEITDIDRIFPGQSVALPEAVGTPAAAGKGPAPQVGDVQALGAVRKCLAGMSQPEADLVSSLNLSKAYSLVGTTLGSGGEAFASLVQQRLSGVSRDLGEVIDGYERMRSGELTRGQYNYRRRRAINRTDRQIGVLRDLITPGRTTSEVVRIDTSNGAVRTGQIEREMRQIARIGRNMARGIWVFRGLSLLGTAQRFSGATTTRERTVIVVETAGGLAGAAAGTALALFLVSTGPIGWTALVGVIAAGAVGGVAGEVLSGAVLERIADDVDHGRVYDICDSRDGSMPIWQPFP